METDERLFVIGFGTIFILLGAIILVYGIIAVFYIIANSAANVSAATSTFSIFDRTTTIVVAVLAAAFVLLTLIFNRRNHNEQIRLSYRVKQLEELYFPLKTALDHTHKIDIDKLEKYSYLATGKLEPLIVSFMKQQKSLSGNRNPLDSDILNAVEHDIPEIQKDLKDYLRI